MTQEQLQHFKGLLEEQKTKLELEIKKLETPPAYEDVPGNEDEVDESTEYFNTTANAESLRDELGRVEHALLKIQNGTYGVCEATGKEIPLEALEINPLLQYHPEYQKEMNK
jgi:RNA polymerase-binding transcription factor DksA